MIDPDLCIHCGEGPQLRDLGGDLGDDDDGLCLRCALERTPGRAIELHEIADRTPESP